MEDLESFMAQAVAEISALPEEGMRLAALASRLASLGPADAARLLDLLYKNRHDKRIAGRILPLLVNPGGLEAGLGSQACRAIYMAAIGQGLTRVSRLFTDLPPHSRGMAGYTKEEEARMEMLTLGQRRALSKSLDKDTIDRLLSDPDPMVVGNLLNNPRVTEKEVVKIASKRPNSPVILRLIAGHRVWSKRLGVKRAVAMNPYTPPRTALGVMESMLTQDLKAISEDDTLHRQVRAHASEIVEERKGMA
ncbi:MAG: hypothetical protein ACE5GY_05790 [Thermodesulfobacteriota bacterium]